MTLPPTQCALHFHRSNLLWWKEGGKTHACFAIHLGLFNTAIFGPKKNNEHYGKLMIESASSGQVSLAPNPYKKRLKAVFDQNEDKPPQKKTVGRKKIWPSAGQTSPHFFARAKILRRALGAAGGRGPSGARGKKLSNIPLLYFRFKILPGAGVAQQMTKRGEMRLGLGLRNATNARGDTRWNSVENSITVFGGFASIEWGHGFLSTT